MNDKPNEEQQKQQFAFTTTNEDGAECDFICPVCNYPLVYEHNLPVCYNCGWYEGIYEGYYDL